MKQYKYNDEVVRFVLDQARKNNAAQETARVIAQATKAAKEVLK